MTSKFIAFYLTCYYMVLAATSVLNTKKLNTFITYDVGQGDALGLVTNMGTNILVDGGPNYEIDRYFSSNFPFKSCPIDLFIVTHPHADHLEGLLRLLYRCPNSAVVYNPVEHDSLLHKNWLDEVEGNKLHELYKGQTLLIDNIKLISVWPPKNFKDPNLNNTSLILEVVADKTKILLTGDAEKTILDQLYVKNIDIYKVSHHGALNGNSKELLNSAKPKFCIISVGEDNKFDHPHKVVLEELFKSGCIVKRSDLDGTVYLNFRSY